MRWYDFINGIYLNYKDSGHFVAHGPYFPNEFKPIIVKWFRGGENLKDLTADFSKAVFSMHWRPDFDAEKWDEKLLGYAKQKNGIGEWGYWSLDRSQRFPMTYWKPKHFYIVQQSLVLHNVQSKDDLSTVIRKIIEICATSCRT